MFLEERSRLRYAVAILATLLSIAPAVATTLVTEHEAALPPDDSALRSAIERGPDIISIYPKPRSGALQSPFDFRVKFEAHGGTKIDLDSLSVVYKRMPAIDLTARVKPFVGPDGIDMPNAEVPAGNQRIWIFIKDTAGHETRADIRFDIER